jgi:hypothetical protein
LPSGEDIVGIGAELAEVSGALELGVPGSLVGAALAESAGVGASLATGALVAAALVDAAALEAGGSGSALVALLVVAAEAEAESLGTACPNSSGLSLSPAQAVAKTSADKGKSARFELKDIDMALMVGLSGASKVARRGGAKRSVALGIVGRARMSPRGAAENCGLNAVARAEGEQ